MSICIVDTSILNNVLDVPHKNQNRDEVLRRLEELFANGTSVLLPIAAIYETGRHISQLDDGEVRRRIADRFVEEVTKALDGEAPWTPTPIHTSGSMKIWLDEFPDAAMRGISLADLSIRKVFEEQCELHLGRRVWVWSYDGDLQGLDRKPPF